MVKFFEFYYFITGILNASCIALYIIESANDVLTELSEAYIELSLLKLFN